VTATAASQLLKFSQNSFGVVNYYAIDDITLTANGPAAITAPEPSNLAFGALAGLAGIGYAWRRRRARRAAQAARAHLGGHSGPGIGPARSQDHGSFVLPHLLELWSTRRIFSFDFQHKGPDDDAHLSTGGRPDRLDGHRARRSDHLCRHPRRPL